MLKLSDVKRRCYSALEVRTARENAKVIGNFPVLVILGVRARERMKGLLIQNMDDVIYDSSIAISSSWMSRPNSGGRLVR